MPTSGEDIALELVFARNLSRLRITAYKIIKKHDIAEEIVQDAFLKLRKSSKEIHINYPLIYCQNIVKNLAIDYWRRKQNESKIFIEDNFIGDMVPSAATPECSAMNRQILIRVGEALDTLPPRTRQAFEMHRLEGLTQRDIARRLGVSATLVNFMIHDASNAIKKYHHLTNN